MIMPPVTQDINKLVYIVTVIGMVGVIGGFALGVYSNNKSTKVDTVLTDQEVLAKAQKCPEAIQLIYDEKWNVFAVKCVHSGSYGGSKNETKR